ncbi:MAG: UvrD-helicase domain-containing protein [Coriobacteriales bacterium]|nr:UvrD-helicase domain-containing protein [Coriobacteriales bacterium]
MAARRLTPDQLQIVETLDRPLFVAAGAGSGKSSTLAERVAWALDSASGEGGKPFVEHLDQVLVITFTRLAAEEIKEKIRERLREGGMEAQALEVDAAWISTIHGMCTRILKRHAFDLGLDPTFKVLETPDASQLVERATDEVLREVSGDPAFAKLFETFSARSGYGADASGTVFGMVRAIRDAVGSALEGFDSVHFPGLMPNVEDALRRLRDDSERALILGRDARAFGSAKGMQEEARLVHDLEVLEHYLALPPVQRAEATSEVMSSLSKPIYAYQKKVLKEVWDDLKKSYPEACLAASFATMGERAAEVMQLARMVDARYVEFKTELGSLDNDDLLSKTFAAFRDHPEIAAHYGSKFRLVMVDEFQDTNAQQVKMIELLSGQDACHLTTVGDAQQSIYRFRAADVQVFRDREVTTDETSRVRLTMNFRSHSDILSFVERALSGGPLKDFMRLDPCPTRPDGLRARSLPRVEIDMISAAYSGGPVAPVRAQALADLIADSILEHITAGERPEDVALLLGRMSNLECYLTALRRRGIDCVVTGGSTFSNAVEVRLVASLLHVLANPKDTQSGLFPVLVSELFSLEADDLCLLATKNQETRDAYARRGIDVGLLGYELPDDATPSPKLAAAHDVLTRALSRLSSWRIEDILRAVLVESGWVARCVDAGPDGQARLANALAAVRYAEDLVHNGGLGVSRAAVEFDHWLDLSKIGPASLSGGSGGAVQIMTVHSSKGLEFPVVAISDCWGNTKVESISGITCENMQGDVYATLVPSGVNAQMLNLKEAQEPSQNSDLVDWARYLVLASTEGDQQEQARLLYVAITRAREAAILGMSVQSTKEGLKPRLASEVVGTLFGGTLPPKGESLLDYGGTEPARVRHVSLSKGEEDTVVVDPADFAGFFQEDEAADSVAPFDFYDVQPSDGLVPVLAEAVAVRNRSDVFSYSSAHALMAASFAPERDEEVGQGPAMQADITVEVALEDEDIDAPVQEGDVDKATNLGSAFHELAQTMIETKADHDPARRAALSRHWHLSARQQTRLEEAIKRWERSDLRSEALTYAVVRPEVPFFIKVDSAYGSYVEGAIDLLCTNPGSNKALVVDYKTGDVGLTLEEVHARHEMQANFYAHVMMNQGYEQVECAFVCVECDRGDGQPIVVRYAFDEENHPRI